jgi:hypothetical protein
MKIFMTCAILACIFVAIPDFAKSATPECGDGSVPKGIWPNCEPCDGGGAQKAIKDIVQRQSDIMDKTVQPKSLDFIDNCLAGLGDAYFNIGLPSLDDLLGALCMVAKSYSQEWVNKLNQDINISLGGGILTAQGGMSSGSSGGIKVKDTSGAARSAANSKLPRP